MSELTKQQLAVENNTSFPNNNTGFITPTLLRTFNGNIIDSMVDEVTYNADSASWTSDIIALEQFSSSLVTNFATVTQLNQSSSTLQSNIDTKLSTASFNTYTASQSPSATGSLLLTASAAGNVITFTKGDSSTFPVTIVTGSTVGFVTTSSFNSYTASDSTNTSASINAATSSLSASITLTVNGKLNSSSFNTYTASASTNVSGAINAASQSLSASLTLTDNSKLNTASFNTYTASAATNVSASINAATSSLSASIAVTDLAQSSSIAQLLGFSSSLDTTFATDTQLSASASTLQNDINTRVLTSSFNTYTASAATNVSGAINTATGSSLITASISGDTITFTKGNGSTFPIVVQTGSGAGDRNGLITTGSSAETQSITGSLIVSGATFNGKIEAPALSIGTTTLDVLFESTASTSASSVVSQIYFTRLGARATGDLTGIRLQTLSGSDTTGDTLLSRITTGVNRHTTTAMTGSVVNTIVQSTWATGSGGTRVTYGSTITANAQSASATITLSAGNAASSNTGGTASIAAGLIRIGTSVSNTISSTGSFGSMILVAPLNTPALSIRSGSFELTTPQGSGSFYSNVAITSSALRINGTAIVKDLIVSGTFGGSGSGSLSVENTISLSGSMSISGSGTITLTGSYAGNIGFSGSVITNVGDTYTSTAEARNIVTLTSASMATLLSGSTTNANTLYFVI